MSKLRIMETLGQVHTAMLRKLRESGLTKADAKELGFEPFTVQALAKKHPSMARNLRPCFRIIYHDVDGRRTRFFRIRFLGPPKRTGFDSLVRHKDLRYMQLAGEYPRAYFPRTIDWKKFFRDSTENRILIITEGELKAACAAKFGFPTIGLGGVWNFKSKGADIIEDLASLPLQKLPIYICYDSDAINNFQVVQAQNALARQLLVLGADVYIVRLPELEPGRKTGLDDFLVARGPKALEKLIAESERWNASEALHTLNEEVVYVEDPGLVVRLDTFQRLSAYDFTKHAFSDRIYTERTTKPDGGIKTAERNAAVEWLKWPGRGKVRRATYNPGESRITELGELNLWPGWGCEPNAGDIRPWHDLLNFLFASAPKNKEWFEQWLAYPIQHPGAKLGTAVLIWSLFQGVGKTAVGEVMQRIYGPENCSAITDNDLNSNFNSWAENKQWIYNEEIDVGRFDEKKSIANLMKPMITRKIITINAKHIRPYRLPDRSNFYFNSNYPNSIPVEDSDRRYFIHEVSGQPKDPKFYTRLFRWLERGGAAAVFDHLLKLDLKGFDPNGHAPMTNSKAEMISMNRNNADSWAMRLKEDPDSILQFCDLIIPLVYLREGELWEIFHPANPEIRNISVMRVALKKVGIGTPTRNQIRCGPYGKTKLRAVRRVAGKPTDAEIGRAMINERKKWMHELKSGGYNPELLRVFGLQILEETKTKGKKTLTK